MPSLFHFRRRVIIESRGLEVENDVIWLGLSCMQYVLAVMQSKYVCIWDLEKIFAMHFRVKELTS